MLIDKHKKKWENKYMKRLTNDEFVQKLSVANPDVGPRFVLL